MHRSTLPAASNLTPVRRGRGVVLVALLWLLSGVAAPVRAQSPAPPPPPPTVAPPKAYVLVDADTGAVLVSSADRVPRPPASLTKVLTALAASAALPHDGTLTISPRAAAQPANKIDAKAGEVWPIQDAMHVMLLRSANDIAFAFAEAVGGSAEGFQDVLTRTAASVGMQDPQTWRDPAGLDDEHSLGGGNLVSARDLAIAGRAFIADPWLSPISAKPRYGFTAPNGVVHDTLNHNKLVLGRYPGAIGGKTGYTKRSGNSLLASAQRAGRTMVAVVMDSKDTYGVASQLFDRGFATPVSAQRGLDRLPTLRLPTAESIRSTPPPPPAPGAATGELGDVAAAPGPEAEPEATPSGTSIPAASSFAAEPASTLDRGPVGVPIAAAGGALVVVGSLAAARRTARRRRRGDYYRVPPRKPVR